MYETSPDLLYDGSVDSHCHVVLGHSDHRANIYSTTLDAAAKLQLVQSDVIERQTNGASYIDARSLQADSLEKENFYPDPIMDNARKSCSSDRPMFGSLSTSIFAKELIPSTMLSAVVHLCIVLILTMMPSYVTSGDESKGDGFVKVKLVEQDPDSVPVDENAGSREAAASVPMMAKRALIPKDQAPVKTDPKPEPFLEMSSSGTKGVPIYDDKSPDNDKRQIDKDQPVTELTKTLKKNDSSQARDRQPDVAIVDTVTADTPHAYDSVVSLPSMASPPRTVSGAEGKAGDEYRNKIFSAISAAAFYPRKALLEKIHGETIVTFTINKNGSIIHLSVNKTSGHNILDEAAISIVKKASKHFPAIPNELMSDSLTYDVPIIFKKKS